MKVRLSLESLRELDMGRISAAWDHELRHVVRDMHDRPTDASPREISLRFTLTPEDDGGVLAAVNGEFEVKSKVPPRRSRRYQLQAHASGVLLVNPESPDDVRQGTLDEAAEGGAD